MAFKDLIDYLEDTENILVSPKNYYHAFNYNHDSFTAILNEGLKAKILLHKEGTGYNGLFYISLSRKEDCLNSAYGMLKTRPAFIIDGQIKTFKTKNIVHDSNYPLILCNTFLPFRTSTYDDEYQRFLKIAPEKIKAIRYELNSVIDNRKKFQSKLLILQNIMQDLEILKKNIPVIDIESQKEFNRDKVLALKLTK